MDSPSPSSDQVCLAKSGLRIFSPPQTFGGVADSVEGVSSLLVVLPARNRSGKIGPGTILLGLSLARRIVLAADRAGFEKIVVLASQVEKMQPLLDGTPAVLASSSDPVPTFAARRIVVIAGDVLPDSKWLRGLLERSLDPDQLDLEPGTAAVIETDAGRRPPSMAPSSWAAPSIDGARDPFAILVGALAGTFGERICRLGDRGMLALTPSVTVAKAETWLLAGLIKETDGLMSRYFARPISLALTRWLVWTKVSANAITLFSTFIGLLGAPFFLSSSPGLQFTGGLLFVAHSVLDGCDGELARLRFEESRFGGLLDFWGDNLVHVAVFASMSAGWSIGVEAVWPLLIGVAAVVGTAASAGFVYWRTMRRKNIRGAVFTSVAQGPNSRMSQIMDAFTRRDFIYLIVLLAAFGKAAWFLTLAAVGAPTFLMALLWLAHSETKLEKASSYE